MKRASALVVGAALLPCLAVAQTAAKPDTAKGQQIASQVCVTCHAADGNSPAAPNPKLAGQFPEYLRKQYRDVVQAHVASLGKLLRDQRIDYALFNTSQPLDTALFAYLATRERLRQVR